jgi:hypothetical protein
MNEPLASHELGGCTLFEGRKVEAIRKRKKRTNGMTN